MYHPETLQPGDVILISGHYPHESIWSRLLDFAIEWSTASPWHHACIVGEGCLVNPLWRVSHDPLDRYATTGWAFRVAGATEAQVQSAVLWAESRIGWRYGVEELLLDAARFDLHWVLKLKHRLPAYTCSGFVFQAWLQAGIRLTWAPFPAPCDLAYSPLLIGDRPNF